MIPWLLSALGLVILLLAGDALVRGAVNLSLRLGVPALIVSLTIVAFGTSAPELLISISAIRDNLPGIALGNVVGSNTANVLLVLGLPAMLALNLAIALLAAEALRGLWRRRRDRTAPALGVAATALVGVHAFFDFSLQMPAVSALYAFIMGLAVAQAFPQARRRNG